MSNRPARPLPVRLGRPNRHGPLAVLAGTALLGVVLLAAPSAALPGADVTTPADAGWASADEAVPTRAVRLVTGELLRVAEPAEGMPSVAFVDPGRSRTFMRAVDPSGDLRVVPDVALPHVGAQLDPALFDVSALVRDGHGTRPDSSVPVVVTYTAGPVDVPGVTVTATLADGRAAGYVDAAGSARLGSALSRLDGDFFAGVDAIRHASTAADAAPAPPAGPLSTLSVDVLPPTGGGDLRGAIGVMGLDSGAFDVYPVEAGALSIEVEVPDGHYAILFYGDRLHASESLSIYSVAAPELEVSGPTDLLLDTNDAVEATYEIDGAEPSDDAVELTSVRLSDALSAGMGWGALFFQEVKVYLTPTEPVTVGTFDQVTQWAGTDDGVFYTLPVVEHGAIPSDLTYELGPDDLAEITSHYARDVDGEYSTGRFAATVAGGGSAITAVEAPGERVDVVTVDGVVTAGLVLLDPAGWIGLDRVAVAPVGGTSVDEHWLDRPVRPAVPDGLKGGAPSRTGDDLSIAVMTFVDPGWSFGRADPGAEAPSIDTVTSQLSADGEVVWSGGELFGDPITVGPDPASYELTLDVERDADWWLTSTATSTRWTFDSARSEEPTPLDLLQVEYDVRLDPYNHADAPLVIGFRPTNLAVPGSPTVDELTAQWSVDDGETWRDVGELFEDDGWWVGGIGGTVCEGRCTVPVSLRVSATDASGATIEQTVTRAFTATFVEPSATPTTTSPEPTESPTTGPPTTEPPTTEPPTTGPTTPEPTGSTTLPGTGGGDATFVAAIGAITLAGGVVAMVLARRRLRD